MTALSRRSFLRGTAAAGLSGATAALLAACSNDNNPLGNAETVEATWSLWGDTALLKRHQEFNDKFNTDQKAVRARFIGLPTDGYAKKITAEVTAGNAPDVFLAGDTLLGQLIASKQLTELGPLLDGPLSKSKMDSFNRSLFAPGTDAEGRVFGVPAACNPMLMWFNQGVLESVGVTESPADRYAAGTWSLEYFQTLVDKVHASKKRAFVFSNWNGELYPWITAAGGKIFDGGRFVAHEDPKTVGAIKWLRDQLAAEKAWYASALPQGQGADAMFAGDQLAFTVTGRWVVPIYRQAKTLKADIVGLPSADGKPAPTIVLASWMVLNKSAKNPEAAFRILTEYVSREGQSFILAGEGGAAIPSINGADQVVLGANYPAHAQTFIDLRDTGYASTTEEARVPGLSGLIFKPLDKYFTEGGDLPGIMAEMGQKVNDAVKRGSI